MFIERRWQPVWLLALSLLMLSSLGLAFGSAVSPTFGWVITLIGDAVGIYFWFTFHSHISVGPDGLHIGRMVLEYSAIADVQALDAEHFLQRIRGSARTDDFFSLLHAKAGGVVITLNDPTDPHKHWVIGAKKATEVVAAIGQAQPTVGSGL